jgi:hypothetical protein
MKIILFFILACSISMSHSRQIAHQNRVHDLLWDIHEMSVGQVSQFSKATGFVSRAEKDGGGFIYEAGWTQKNIGHGENHLASLPKTMSLLFISHLKRRNRFVVFLKKDYLPMPNG